MGTLFLTDNCSDTIRFKFDFECAEVPLIVYM